MPGRNPPMNAPWRSASGCWGPSIPTSPRASTTWPCSTATQGRYAEAEPLYQRALALREQALGPDHPEVAHSLNNLAGSTGRRGATPRPSPSTSGPWPSASRRWGPTHPQVADSLNNLAVLYHAQGRYGEAEPLYQRALAVCERALGPEHPDVAASLNNLAMLYHAQGRYAEAEPLFQRALAILEEALGPQHPKIATGLHNLAWAYCSQARRWWDIKIFALIIGIGCGVGLLLQVGDQVGAVLGPFHMVPIVIRLVGGLAGLGGMLYFVWFVRHGFAKAEPLFQRALAIQEQALGPQHPQIAADLNYLATIYLIQGRKAKAKPLLQRALAICEQALGLQHPQIAALVRKNYIRSQEDLW